MATKTPMMFVNEWVQKRSMDYIIKKDTHSISKDQTNPEFETAITVLPKDASRGLPTYTVTGVGRNKKAADQEAAAKMMRELKLELTTAEGARAFLPAIPSTSLSADALGYAPLPKLDDMDLLKKASDFNSGTALKELCLLRGWNEPEAKFQDFGPAHSKVFVCTIEFLGIKEQGTAKTKGDAKKLARYKILTSCNALEKVKREDANGDRNVSEIETSTVRYDGRAPCDVELKGRQCYGKLEHASHQMLREFETGTQLKILLDATKDFLARNFTVIPSREVENLLKSKVEAVAFFSRLMEELGMTVETSFFDDETDANFSMDIDDDDDSDSNSSFYSCNSDVIDQDEGDSNDAKNSMQLKSTEKIEIEENGNFKPSFVCHVHCSVNSKDSGRMISVSGFGIQSTKPEAYKDAILEILASIAVLCR